MTNNTEPDERNWHNATPQVVIMEITNVKSYVPPLEVENEQNVTPL